MSKVQPNHNRRIMQTVLGQLESLCAGNIRRSFGSFRGRWGSGMGKEKQKTSNIVRTAFFRMCRYMYYRYIYKYHCGEKRGVPRCEEVTAKKENLLD